MALVLANALFVILCFRNAFFLLMRGKTISLVGVTMKVVKFKMHSGRPK